MTRPPSFFGRSASMGLVGTSFIFKSRPAFFAILPYGGIPYVPSFYL